MNILMVGPALQSKGGMATVEKQFIAKLSGEEFAVDFISTYDDLGLLRKALKFLFSLYKFNRCIDKYDLVHIHSASRGSLIRKSFFLRKAKRKGKKTILHLHGGEFSLWFDKELSPRKQRKVREIFDIADVILVLSAEWKAWMTEKGFPKERIIVMHNGVDVPPHSVSDDVPPNVLFLGRLDSNKSPDLIIRAAVGIVKDYPATEFIFAGNGDIDFYKEIAEKLGVGSHCIFMGWVDGDEKEGLYHKASIYCLPSKNEGMPMSVLEAMSYGLATVSTPVGGIPQIIRNGKNGYLAAVDDVDELESILKRLIGDSILRCRIGQNGRRTIIQEFNLDKNIEQLKLIYRGLIYETSINL